MIINKQEILERICYTDLVYERINNKMNANFSKVQIEDYILKILKESNINCFTKIGKNYYVTNSENNMRITINSKTFRVITVDKTK